MNLKGVSRLCAVLITANAEWQPICELFPDREQQASPFGDWFWERSLPVQASQGANQPLGKLLFFHTGWGKIAAAAATQYVIDRWGPQLLVNLGTCGGFEGAVERGDIILVEKTIVYDILEQMGDYDAHIAHYTTEMDLSWLTQPYPTPVVRTLLVSGDRDLLPDELPILKERYGAVAGDWESGAIAWVGKRNSVRTLILRGVTDLVGAGGGEAYGNLALYQEATRQVMRRLVQALPRWLKAAMP